ncbi:tRNA pseudouridine(55) synthase TruB [Tepidicaulis sp.]|uniref:tRNA pseudouridine(55) synthase TruB n=1 Tax=Tepidicaulis sp. TaxID=1920809 RepID=UPI003B5BD916
MARRRKGRPVSGWVIIDKPVGPTSTHVVNIVRRAFDAQKAGHAGTLDPLATGILPVALGEATKTIPFVMDARKTYRFTVKWGEATATDDAEGEVIARSDLRPARAEIEAVLSRFTGEIEQVPPQFSAIKVEGERAYDLARAGVEVELKARKVTIFKIKLTGMPDEAHAEFEILCSKGTYVRSLARDMAEALGTCGHVVKLHRAATGPFAEAASIPLEKLKDLSHSAPASGPLEAFLLPIETALDDIPALALDGSDTAKLKRGQAVLLRGRDAPVFDGPVLTLHKGEPVALTEYDRGSLRPVRVFNLSH